MDMEKHSLLCKGLKGLRKETTQSENAILGARTEVNRSVAEAYALNNNLRN